MIRIENTRFGTLDIEEGNIVTLPAGLVGFPSETRFAIVHGGEDAVAHLQSLDTPAVALPVVDGIAFGPSYPNPGTNELAKAMGFGEDIVILVPIARHADSEEVCANLLAPILVDAASRTAAQIVLDPARFSTKHTIRLETARAA